MNILTTSTRLTGLLIHFMIFTMAPATVPRIGRPGGLSLYANLLDSPSTQEPTPGTISRAPVVFKQNAEDDAQQDRAANEKSQISAGRY